MSAKWTQPDPETPGDWTVEVGTDCFSSERGFVVMLDTKDGDGGDTLIELSADTAREIAASLMVEADRTDMNNARIAAEQALFDFADNRKGE